MRIIAGKYRGKKLFSPSGDGVRPTSDRTREALFNILNSKLGNNWENLKVLDIFAGTGALGLEALSRGAAELCLIDTNTQTLTKNAKLFANEKMEIIKADATALPNAKAKFNLFFMDAPYKKGLSELALAELVKKNWLESDAVGVIEVEKKEKIELPQEFEIIDERTYGIAKLYFVVLS